MGVILAFASAVLYAINGFLSKLSVDKTKSPDAVGVIFQLTAGFICLTFFFFEKPEIYKSDPTVWFLLVLACLMYSFFTWMGNRSNKLLQLSVNTVLSQLTPVLFFIAALIIFQEAFTVQKLVGVSLLIGANILVFGAMRATKNINMKGVYLKLGASLVLTVGLLCDAANSDNFSPALYSCIAFFVSGLGTIIIARVRLKELLWELKSNWKIQLLVGISGAVGYYCFVRALSLAPKSIVMPINNLNAIIMVILGIIILHERNHLKRKIFAIVLAFVGAALLAV